MNSLMKGANGGKPISANVPARKSAPVNGAARNKSAHVAKFPRCDI